MGKLIWLMLAVTQNAWAVDGASLGFPGLITIFLMIGAAALPFILIGAFVCFVLFVIWKKFFSKLFLGNLSQEDKEDVGDK